jgi:CMP-N,N'-diacetyllegionaminic acid synthase
MDSILGIIPARSGSKRLPKKNIRQLAGKPLIAWSIEAALDSKALSRLIVSTDSEEIAAIAKKYGAEAPFLRPADIATDTATSVEVARHALDFLASQNKTLPAYTLLLQPTSPLRTAQDIIECVNIMNETSCDAVVSVFALTHSPAALKTISKTGNLENLFSGADPSSKTMYMLNGALYLIKTKVLLEKNTFCPDGCKPYLMPKERSADIDDEADFFAAEKFMLSSC